MSRLLSVVVPAFNEAQHIDKAMHTIGAALDAAGFITGMWRGWFHRLRRVW